MNQNIVIVKYTQGKDSYYRDVSVCEASCSKRYKIK